MRFNRILAEIYFYNTYFKHIQFIFLPLYIIKVVGICLRLLFISLVYSNNQFSIKYFYRL